MKMNKLLSLFLPAALLLLAGCAASGTEPEAPSGTENPEISVLSSESAGPAAIDLNAPSALVQGAEYENGVFTIREPGQYRITGTLEGQLRVDTDDPVELILAGTYIRGQEAIAVLSHDAVTITTEAGTENTLYDGAEHADENATAVIRANGPLTLGGEGRLTVLAGANNGIQSKSILTVAGGDITVKAANNGIKADSLLTVSGGTVDITAGGDALRAEAGRISFGDITVSGGTITAAANERGLQADGTVNITGGSLSLTAADDAVKGSAVSISGGEITSASACDGIQADTTLFVSGGTLSVASGEDGLSGGEVVLAGGSILIDAASDGVQADTALSVTGGSLSVTTAGGGGDAINKSGESFGPWSRSETASDVSAKGLKSGGEITVSGGVIDLNTADDAVHAAALLTIEGGEMTVLSSDDALHSDDMLVIDDGVVNITDCFEGIEAFAIEVNGGDIIIRAVNDGINANGSEFGMFGPWGRGREAESEEVEITSLSGEATTYYRQTGGSVDLVVIGNTWNCGDGIDSNGNVFIDGGVLVVSTFGNTMEGGIDTGRDGPIVTGGMVLAGGAAMMQETWAEGSTQCCAVVYCDLQPGGTPITIRDEAGNEVWTATLANTFNCFILSHPALETGHVYTVDYGGGTETLDFSESNILRVGGSSRWGFPGRW